MTLVRQLRINTLNKMTKEELQNLSPLVFNYYTFSPKAIIEFIDSKLLDFTNEQLSHLSAQILSYMNLEVLESLLQMHKDETEDCIITIFDKYKNKEDYSLKDITVSGNAIRIKNAIRMKKEKQILQNRILELRQKNLNDYEQDGRLPLNIVCAYLFDAYTFAYMDDKSFLAYMEFNQFLTSEPIEINDTIYVDKEDILRVLNNACNNSNYKFNEIPKLSSRSSLKELPVKFLEFKVWDYEHVINQYKEDIIILSFKHEKFYLEQDVKLIFSLI